MAHYTICFLVDGSLFDELHDDFSDEQEARAELWMFLSRSLARKAEQLINANLITAELRDGPGTVVWRISVAGGRPV